MRNLSKCIAKKLRILRTERGWTKTKTAQLIGVSLSTYRKWEDAQTLIATHNLIKIAELYQISLSQFFR